MFTFWDRRMVLDRGRCLKLDMRQRSQHVLESRGLLFSTYLSQHILFL